MELSSWRLKDQVHVQAMDAAGLITPAVQSLLPEGLEKLAAGETVDQILSEHPRLTEAGIRAAIAFAAKVLGAEVVYPAEHARV
jgi:hypothetical protein